MAVTGLAHCRVTDKSSMWWRISWPTSELTAPQTVLSDVVGGSGFNNAYPVTKLLETGSAGKGNLCYKLAYLVH